MSFAQLFSFRNCGHRPTNCIFGKEQTLNNKAEGLHECMKNKALALSVGRTPSTNMLTAIGSRWGKGLEGNGRGGGD